MIIIIVVSGRALAYMGRSYRHTFAVADILLIYVNYHVMKCSNVSVRMLKYASFLCKL